MTVCVAVLLLIQQASPTPVEAHDPLKFWVQVAAIIAGVVALITFFLTRTIPWLKARRDRRSIQKRIGAESYTPDGLENAFRNFVPPLCQDVDPSGGDEPRNVYGVRQPLFSALDEALSHPETNKYFILLADSGMGKTTALLNYYLRHIRRWRSPRYRLALVPLNTPDADERIAAITDREDTVLFLDALDEDTLAIVDYVERLRILLKATAHFRAVLISCRTQFFSKDEEIPKETGRIRIADRRAGQEAEYYFQKIYLSPFTDAQVNKYLKRKYRFRRRERKIAFSVVKKIRHLTARPMLLAHIDDILKAKDDFRFSFELYEGMVEAWLRREKGLVQEIDKLRSFSERLAVDLYAKRAERKAEKIPREEMLALAKGWDIDVDGWKLSGRSLLNRDAEGNFKFAHRSIMEYLFVRRFLSGDEATLSTEWTDQMHLFLYEHLLSHSTLRNFPDHENLHALNVMLRGGKIDYFLNSIIIASERGMGPDMETAAKMGALFIAIALRKESPKDVRVTWTTMRLPGITNPIASATQMAPSFGVESDGRECRLLNFTRLGGAISIDPFPFGELSYDSRLSEFQREFNIRQVGRKDGIRTPSLIELSFLLPGQPKQLLDVSVVPPLSRDGMEAALKIMNTFGSIIRGRIKISAASSSTGGRHPA